MHRLKAYFGVIFETWQARRSLGFKGDCSWGFARAAGGALRCVAFRTAPSYRGLCRSARLRNGTTQLNAVPRACRLEFTEAYVFWHRTFTKCFEQYQRLTRTISTAHAAKEILIA